MYSLLEQTQTQMKTYSKWVETKKLEQDAFVASIKPLKIY